ncbi:hypothetical protein [Streptomyces sp. NPDC059072]
MVRVLRGWVSGLSSPPADPLAVAAVVLVPRTTVTQAHTLAALHEVLQD